MDESCRQCASLGRGARKDHLKTTDKEQYREQNKTSTAFLSISRDKTKVEHKKSCPQTYEHLPRSYGSSLRGTSSYIHFRLSPLLCPFWSVPTACGHDQGVALSNMQQVRSSLHVGVHGQRQSGLDTGFSSRRARR